METINYFDCSRCQRPHFEGELLYSIHALAARHFKTMPAVDRPAPGHILWISNIYDRDGADTSRIVVLNLVTANESGYMPITSLTLPLGEARIYRDEYHARLGLSAAQVEAIEASSMFYDNGVRYPDNLKNYVKHTNSEWHEYPEFGCSYRLDGGRLMYSAAEGEESEVEISALELTMQTRLGAIIGELEKKA